MACSHSPLCARADNRWAVPEQLWIDSNQSVRIANLSHPTNTHPTAIYLLKTLGFNSPMPLLLPWQLRRPLRSAVFGVRVVCAPADVTCRELVDGRVSRADSRVNITMLMFAQRAGDEDVACVQWDALAARWSSAGCYRYALLPKRNKNSLTRTMKHTSQSLWVTLSHKQNPLKFMHN